MARQEHRTSTNSQGRFVSLFDFSFDFCLAQLIEFALSVDIFAFVREKGRKNVRLVGFLVASFWLSGSKRKFELRKLLHFSFIYTAFILSNAYIDHNAGIVCTYLGF